MKSHNLPGLRPSVSLSCLPSRGESQRLLARPCSARLRATPDPDAAADPWYIVPLRHCAHPQPYLIPRHELWPNSAVRLGQRSIHYSIMQFHAFNLV